MKKTIALIMGALLALSMCAVAFAADDSATTTAKIEFIEGPLEFIDEPGDLDTGWSTMNIDFKTQYLPTGATTYTANTYMQSAGVPMTNPILGYVLRVSDAREAAGEWSVTVEVNENFAADNGTDPAFDGLLTLKNGSFVTAGGQTVTNPPASIALNTENIGNAYAQPVVSVDDSVTHDQFDVKWTAANITLDIDGANAATVELGGYTAKLLWTLIDESIAP